MFPFQQNKQVLPKFKKVPWAPIASTSTTGGVFITRMPRTDNVESSWGTLGPTPLSTFSFGAELRGDSGTDWSKPLGHSFGLSSEEVAATMQRQEIEKDALSIEVSRRQGEQEKESPSKRQWHEDRICFGNRASVPILPPPGEKWADFAETDDSEGGTPCVRMTGAKSWKEKEGTIFYDWELLRCIKLQRIILTRGDGQALPPREKGHRRGPIDFSSDEDEEEDKDRNDAYSVQYLGEDCHEGFLLPLKVRFVTSDPNQRQTWRPSSKVWRGQEFKLKLKRYGGPQEALGRWFEELITEVRNTEGQVIVIKFRRSLDKHLQDHIAELGSDHPSNEDLLAWSEAAHHLDANQAANQAFSTSGCSSVSSGPPLHHPIPALSRPAPVTAPVYAPPPGSPLHSFPMPVQSHVSLLVPMESRASS
ncbi:hypothetical protein BU17DRAFT_95923 [Hysterangium stoloniferum]|nr:hypothetical protein BU17DRAFT_95923 [Hysterangium stoloniferum]